MKEQLKKEERHQPSFITPLRFSTVYNPLDKLKVVIIWERLEDQETDERPRIWKHRKSGEKVKVERFENGTWDTFHGEKLIENYDTVEEAINRGNELVGSS